MIKLSDHSKARRGHAPDNDGANGHAAGTRDPDFTRQGSNRSARLGQRQQTGELDENRSARSGWGGRGLDNDKAHGFGTLGPKSCPRGARDVFGVGRPKDRTVYAGSAATPQLLDEGGHVKRTDSMLSVGGDFVFVDDGGKKTKPVRAPRLLMQHSLAWHAILNHVS